MKRILYSLAIIGLLVLAWSWYSAREIHKPVSVDEVSRIRIWGASVITDMATKEETENIIKWFNSASDIRENKGFAGTTPEAGIYIDLKSGRTISIIRSGSDFEVQKGTVTGRTSYWAKQSELRKLLDRLAGQ